MTDPSFVYDERDRIDAELDEREPPEYWDWQYPSFVKERRLTMETKICLNCGELVPQGCCTCGTRQELAELAAQKRKQAQEQYIIQLAAERNLTVEQLEARITYDLCNYLPPATGNVLLGMLEAARRVNGNEMSNTKTERRKER